MIRHLKVMVRVMISNAYLLPMFRLLVIHIHIRNVRRELVNSVNTRMNPAWEILLLKYLGWPRMERCGRDVCTWACCEKKTKIERLLGMVRIGRVADMQNNLSLVSHTS